MSGEGDSQIRLDATSLRGIAHPLRVRILGLLRAYGPSTATRIAERIGQSTGSTSYHLRQLAAYGFVVEEAGRGVGRERWWRAAHQRTLLDRAEVSRDAPAETEVYLRSVASVYAERVDRWLGDLPSMTPEWSGTSMISDWWLWLTPAEAKRLHDEVIALIGRFLQNQPEDAVKAPPQTRRMVAQIQLMPFPEESPTAEQVEPLDPVEPPDPAGTPEPPSDPARS